MPRQTKVTEVTLRTAAADSLSFAQVIVKLGLIPAGGNYKTVQEKIKAYNIDISHFTGSAWSQGSRHRSFGKYPSLEELLVIGSTCQSFKLKNRLIRCELPQKICSSCGLSQ